MAGAAVAAAAASEAISPPTRTELMLLDQEMRDIYRAATRRADGTSTRGRKTKHDTATRRWIDTVGFPLLSLGKLPEAHDMAMLRSGPRAGLQGTHRTARDAWSQLHARDPRSKQLTAAEALGQQTLLKWARSNISDALTRSAVQRGRPPNYTLHFGEWKGWSIRQLVALASKSYGEQQTAMQRAKAKVPPGDYVLWLSGQKGNATTEFRFIYPYHFYLYLSLRELDSEACVVKRSSGEQVALHLPPRVQEQYDTYCDIRLAPVTPAPDADDGAGVAPQPASDDDEQQPAAGALHAPGPQAEVDPIETATPLAQKQFFEEQLLAVANGEAPPYKEWQRLEVTPPEPLCVPCGSCDAYNLKPIKFWSHERWSIATPCANHGWAHAEFVTLGKWRMRRVKDVFDDFYLAGRETSCSKCKEEKLALKKAAATAEAALKAAGESEDHPELAAQLATLEAEVKACKYTSSTLNATVNRHVFERYPGIGAAFPAILTHKAAISMEAMMVISRAARTAQSSHDLEAMFNEFRSIKAAKNRLGFYQLQRMAGVQPGDVAHYECGISTISDSYITEAINVFHETHLRYILQWSEQNIVMDTVAADHHGKRWARSQFEGAELLKWRYTAFNSAGQSGIAVNTETCSMKDPALVAAHRSQRRVAKLWKHGSPAAATCDNPAKDGPGLVAAVWAGDGMPECLFPGTAVLVETEAQCDEACAYLRRFDVLGMDAENVAYLDGSGDNSDKAALVQLCGDDQRCFLFAVHKWPVCFGSFASLMADSTITKVGVNVSGDVARIRKRFASSSSGAAPTRGRPFDAVGGDEDLAPRVAHLNLPTASLAKMASAVLGLYLDKSIDHRCWEAPVLSPRHVEYAAADAWAHLQVWRVAPTKTAADVAADDGPLGAAPLDPVAEEGGGDDDGDGDDSDTELIEPPEGSDESGDDDGADDGDQRPRRRTATYRHQPHGQPGRRRRRGGVQLVGGLTGGGAFDPAVLAQVDGAVGSSVGDDDGADEADAPDDDDADDAATGPAQAASAEAALEQAEQQMRAYAGSTRQSDLLLPPCFSRAERRKLHTLAATLKLEHRTVGVESDAQLLIFKWKPLRCFTAAVGSEAVGGTVAKDAPPPPPAAPPRRTARGAAGSSTAPMGLDRGWAAGDYVLVPTAVYPDYYCSEGDGWLAQIVSISGSGAEEAARLRFVRARTRDGRTFQDARLLVSVLQPPPDGAAAAAAAASGNHGVVRGTVQAFDDHAMLWQLSYTDGSSESVGIDLLNVRLQRRHAVDAAGDGEDGDDDGDDDSGGGGGLGALPVPSVGGPADGAQLQKLLDGIHPQWQRGRLKYDIRHFMANFSMMVAAQKDSPTYGKFMAYVSAAIFKILPGEHARVRRHMEGLGMSAEAISRAPRRYWRRMARYSCPDPEIITRHLYDVFSFFSTMKDPARPTSNFFVADAWAIFVKEIGYVQKGYLSDVPGMNMYVYQRTCARTGYIFYRSRRSSSALEGYHLHLRAAQHPCAKSSGYKLETARTNLFDFAWNVRAAERAGHLPRHGHFSLWLVDTLAKLCDGWLEPDTDAYPPALQGWRRTRLDVAPLTTRGIDWPQLKALTSAGAQAIGLSTLERPEEVQAVLQHAALASAGDAAGIERATGLRTSASRLQRLVARACAEAASDAMLNAAGVVDLQARLYGTAGDAPPRELVVSAPPRPVQPDTRGPLPFDAGQRGGAGSAAAVVAPAPVPPPPPPPEENEEMGDVGGGGGGGGDDGDEMDEGEDEGDGGSEGGGRPACTCGKAQGTRGQCRCPWWLAMTVQERKRRTNAKAQRLRQEKGGEAARLQKNEKQAGRDRTKRGRVEEADEEEEAQQPEEQPVLRRCARAFGWAVGL